MKINYLHIKNFRSYKDYSIHFSDNTNIFIGDNAVGKTNLIEAIYFLSLSKSFKTNSNSQIIMFDNEFSSIEGHISAVNRKRELQIFISKELKKCKVDGSFVNKVSEYIGLFNVVLFIPDDLSLIKGSPKIRRKFIDIELSKVSPIYIFNINKYNNLLKEKNTYLKKTSKIDYLYIDVINEQLSKLEFDIITKRIAFIEKINLKVKKIYKNFNEKEKIFVSYDSFINIEKFSLNEIIDCHKNSVSNDIKYKQSMVGIHRDDLVVYLNDKLATNFSSQGQQRSIVLSLKIALLEVIYDEVGEYPILLLDDVLSELDDHRKTMLLNLLNKNIQTFITTTSLDGINHNIINDSNKIYIDVSEREGK